MKVLHVLAQLPMRTGSGVYFTNLVEGLASHGANNALIYGTQNPYEIRFEEMEIYPVVFQSDTISFPIVGMSDEMPYDNTIYSEMTDEMVIEWQAAFRHQLERAQEEFRPDVVVSHHLWYLTSMVCDIFSDIPVVGLCHGTDIRQAKQHPDLKERYVHDLKRLAAVFALSQKDIALIHEVYGIDPEKIYVTAAGFNQHIFNDHGISRPQDQLNVVYAGKLAHAKGIYELAKTFPRLKAKYPTLAMHLIGRTGDESLGQLRELAGNDEDFLIYDVKNQESLAQCMKQCDVFVLPSYYEGMGLIAIEALACKLRVVVTEIEGLMELLGEEINQSDVIEYVSLPRLHNQDEPLLEDIPAYVERLTEALDRQLARTIAQVSFDEAIYQKIYQHSWQEVIKYQHELIEDLLPTND